MSEEERLKCIGHEIKLAEDFARLLRSEVWKRVSAYCSVQGGSDVDTPAVEVSAALTTLNLKVEEPDATERFKFSASSKFTRVEVVPNNPPGTVVFKRFAANAVFAGEASIAVLWISVRLDLQPVNHQFILIGGGWLANESGEPKTDDLNNACADYTQWLGGSIVDKIFPDISVIDEDIRLARCGKLDA